MTQRRAAHGGRLSETTLASGEEPAGGMDVVNEESGRCFEPAPGRNWLVGASASLRF